MDDGLTGVFFDRPAFVEFMTLIEQEKVRAVIVKDLSRLGRNYRDTGELTETIFPDYNIRFIAIGDGIDQKNEPDPRRLNGGIDITVAFKNPMNECYVQDSSNKVRLSNISKIGKALPLGNHPMATSTMKATTSYGQKFHCYRHLPTTSFEKYSFVRNTGHV